jgi:hypothetical protein
MQRTQKAALLILALNRVAALTNPNWPLYNG